MFSKGRRLSLLKSWSRKDATELQPNPLPNTDDQHPQHSKAKKHSKTDLNSNIAQVNINNEINQEQQPSLISQLVLASARRSNESGTETRSEKSSDDQPFEEFDPTQWGIKVIRKQPPEKVGAVDIIAIHGLGGSWEAAWIDSNTHVNWLNSLLAEDIPHARIMSYSYNSREYFSTSNADIRDFASDLLVDYKYYRTSVAEKSRPTIFLCHSLGGIVFKQALIRANEEPEYSNILEHVHGVVFFGTPHRGASSAKWGSIAANVVRAASLNTCTNVISKNLKLRSDLLSNIAESWIRRGANLEIISCYETMSMHGTIVVEQDSALLRWPNEIVIPMNANHSTICKFANRGEPDYRKVISRLKEMSERGIQKFKDTEQTLSEAQQQLLACLETTDYESHLTEIVQFVKGTCKWILQTERYREWDDSTTGRLLWISADAGCGKSVLARYLIQYHKKLKVKANVYFFIFKNGNSEQEDGVHGLSALLHQIYSSQPNLMEHAFHKQRSFARGNNLKKPFEALWDAFENTIHDERLKDTLCVVDALDECEESTRLLLVEKLALLFSKDRKKAFPLKFIITSRPDNTIKSAFMTIPNIRLKGEDELIALNHDIRVFVQTSVNQIAARSDLPLDLLTDLQHALIDGADFTFLWTSLVVQLLKERSVGGLSRADLESILRTRNLDDLYENLLRSRPSPLKAKKILYIVIAAARPLSLEELSIAAEVHQDYKGSWRKALPPGKKLDMRKMADIRKMENSDPLQSYGRLGCLDDVNQYITHPFSNHIRLVCGNFLRIRGHKVYLVHQTARQFLLQETSRADFSVGYYLREFRWNVSRPTAKEMRQVEQHGIPGIFEGEKDDASLQPLQIWRHSIRYDVANRYLFQVCVDYMRLLEDEMAVQQRFLPKGVPDWIKHQRTEFISPETKDASEWTLEIKSHPCGAFLDYAARFWVVHYQSVRTDVDGYFDCFCMPHDPLFKLWIKQHPSFTTKNQGEQVTESKPISIPDKGMSMSRNTGETSLQDVLDFFDLDLSASELWDQENVEGSHYWKHSDGSSLDENDEDDFDENDDEPMVPRKNSPALKMSQMPDRIRSFRRQNREGVSATMELASNPGTFGLSYLSAENSMRFSSFVEPRSAELVETNSAVLVQRGFRTRFNPQIPKPEAEKLASQPAVFGVKKPLRISE